MPSPTPYDRLASIYDVWIEHYQADLGPMLDFYVERYVSTVGPVVELGVGNGRILIEAAKAGRPVIGIDNSEKMIELCRTRAREAGVADRVHLMLADFREFRLPEPAALITMPYEAIAHLLTVESKSSCFANVYSQLFSGGRFILDQRAYDPDVAAANDTKARLMFTYTDQESGLETLVWLATLHDIPNQSWRTISWIETVGTDGLMTRRKLSDLRGCIADTATMRMMLEAAGFEIEACLGGFDVNIPRTDVSEQEVWLARRPVS